jgi:hypothetical protein
VRGQSDGRKRVNELISMGFQTNRAMRMSFMMSKVGKVRWIRFGKQDGNRDGLGQVEIRFRER